MATQFKTSFEGPRLPKFSAYENWERKKLSKDQISIRLNTHIFMQIGNVLFFWVSDSRRDPHQMGWLRNGLSPYLSGTWGRPTNTSRHNKIIDAFKICISLDTADAAQGWAHLQSQCHSASAHTPRGGHRTGPWPMAQKRSPRPGDDSSGGQVRGRSI